MSADFTCALLTVPLELALVVLGPLNLCNALRRFRIGDTAAGTALAIVAAAGAIALIVLDAARRGVKL